MVQLERTADGGARHQAQKVVVTKVEVVGKRFHRVTLKWSLNVPPPPEWVEAFSDAVVAGDSFHWRVPSAYGQPMVMHDQSIVWAMFEAEARTALSFVDQAVGRANSRFDDLRDPTAQLECSGRLSETRGPHADTGQSGVSTRPNATTHPYLG